MSEKDLALLVRTTAIALSEGSDAYDYYDIDGDLKELEEAVSEVQAENAELQELVRMMLRSYDTPDCSACYNKWSCDNHLLSECVKVTECRDRARELGIEV